MLLFMFASGGAPCNLPIYYLFENPYTISPRFIADYLHMLRFLYTTSTSFPEGPLTILPPGACPETEPKANKSYFLMNPYSN